MSTVRVRTDLPPDMDDARVTEALRALGVAIIERLQSLARAGLRLERIDGERLCLGLSPRTLEVLVKYVEVIS